MFSKFLNKYRALGAHRVLRQVPGKSMQRWLGCTHLARRSLLNHTPGYVIIGMAGPPTALRFATSLLLAVFITTCPLPTPCTKIRLEPLAAIAARLLPRTLDHPIAWTINSRFARISLRDTTAIEVAYFCRANPD
jgi:hypothetical protein